MQKCPKCNKVELVHFKTEKNKNITTYSYICPHCEKISREIIDELKLKEEEDKRIKARKEAEELFYSKMKKIDWTKINCPKCNTPLPPTAFQKDFAKGEYWNFYSCPTCKHFMNLCVECFRVMELIVYPKITHQKCSGCGKIEYASDTCGECKQGEMQIVGGCDPRWDTKCTNCGTEGTTM